MTALADAARTMLRLAALLALPVAAAAQAPATSVAPAPRPAATAAAPVPASVPQAEPVPRAVPQGGRAGAPPASRPRARPAPPAVTASSSNPVDVTSAQGLTFSTAMDAVRAGNWAAARRRAAAVGPLAEDIVLWHELRARRGSWAEALDFVRRNADWPGLPLLRARAEGLIPEGATLGQVRELLGGAAPATGSGALRLAEALRGGGDPGAAEGVLIDAWRTLSMTAAQEDAVLRAAGSDTLAPHHEARLDALLWAKTDAGARPGDGARGAGMARPGGGAAGAAFGARGGERRDRPGAVGAGG